MYIHFNGPTLSATGTGCHAASQTMTLLFLSSRLIPDSSWALSWFLPELLAALCSLGGILRCCDGPVEKFVPGFCSELNC